MLSVGSGQRRIGQYGHVTNEVDLRRRRRRRPRRNKARGTELERNYGGELEPVAGQWKPEAFIKATSADWISVIECVAFEIIGNRRKYDKVLSGKECPTRKKEMARIKLWNVFFLLLKKVDWLIDWLIELRCQFPTWRSPVLCSFDRDNWMYEQQTWMLTLGLLNRKTGCQCCSVRCSSVSERHLGFSKVENFNFRSGWEAQYASSISPRRSWQRDIARYYVKLQNFPTPA